LSSHREHSYVLVTSSNLPAPSVKPALSVTIPSTEPDRPERTPASKALATRHAAGFALASVPFTALYQVYIFQLYALLMQIARLAGYFT
ncbi:hypothetical protein K443DRAFT_107528, partial [Laccaria amethystina LaAM-08-1]